MRLRTSWETGGFSGSLALSAGLHAALVTLVLLWGGVGRPLAPPILTVTLVAPGPSAAPPGTGDAPAPGLSKTAAVLPPARPAPPVRFAPPRVAKKPVRREAPPLPRPEPELVVLKPSVKPPLLPAGLPGPTKVAASSPAAPAASGSSGGQVRVGPGGPSSAVLGFGGGGPGPGGGHTTQTQNDYLKLIRARILAKRDYPLQARQRHQEGVVRLRFTLSAAGALAQGVQVVKPSGFLVLDDQARHCVQAAAPFPPIPPDLKRDRLTVEVPIVYQLSTPER